MRVYLFSARPCKQKILNFIGIDYYATEIDIHIELRETTEKKKSFAEEDESKERNEYLMSMTDPTLKTTSTRNEHESRSTMRLLNCVVISVEHQRKHNLVIFALRNRPNVSILHLNEIHTKTFP